MTVSHNPFDDIPPSLTSTEDEITPIVWVGCRECNEINKTPVGIWITPDKLLDTTVSIIHLRAGVHRGQELESVHNISGMKVHHTLNMPGEQKMLPSTAYYSRKKI